MKSITKYISLLTIAILAISAFGTASASENHVNGTDIDLFYSVSAGPQYITDDKLNAINELFDLANVSKDAFVVTVKYGQTNFIKFNQQVVPLVGIVSTFNDYDPVSDVATFTDNKYRLFVLP